MITVAGNPTNKISTLFREMIVQNNNLDIV